MTTAQFDKQLQQNIAGSMAPVTAQTHIRSDHLKAVGAQAVGDDESALEEVLDVIGSTIKDAGSDITGQSKTREGKAKRFLNILKVKLLRKAQQQGGEVKAVENK